MRIFTQERLTQYLKDAGFSQIAAHVNRKQHWICLLAEKVRQAEPLIQNEDLQRFVLRLLKDYNENTMEIISEILDLIVRGHWATR